MSQPIHVIHLKSPYEVTWFPNIKAAAGHYDVKHSSISQVLQGFSYTFLNKSYTAEYSSTYPPPKPRKSYYIKRRVRTPKQPMKKLAITKIDGVSYVGNMKLSDYLNGLVEHMIEIDEDYIDNDSDNTDIP